MDVGGLVPVFLTLTKGLTENESRNVIVQALFTAFCISAAFIAVGRLIFRVIGITPSDFEMAGGALLLVLAIMEMLQRGDRESLPNIHAGPVPLGTPLTVGPAVLTSLIILIELRGYAATLLALIANLLLVGVGFWQSRRVVKIIGPQGLRAMSQVISLFLAAIGVSMIRRGFEALH
jgi:multiple antibiotic resistance protein